MSKFFGPNLTIFILFPARAGARGRNVDEMKLPLRLVCRTSWIDIQQSRESPGNLWAFKPVADIDFASSV